MDLLGPSQLETVVGARVLADAVVSTREWRLAAGEDGVLLLRGPWPRRFAARDREIGPSSGPDHCWLAVTDDDVVAVSTGGGWLRPVALDVVDGIPRAQLTGAWTENRFLLGLLVIRFGPGQQQWVFEGNRGVPTRQFRRVVAALDR